MKSQMYQGSQHQRSLKCTMVVPMYQCSSDISMQSLSSNAVPYRCCTTLLALHNYLYTFLAMYYLYQNHLDSFQFNIFIDFSWPFSYGRKCDKCIDLRDCSGCKQMTLQMKWIIFAVVFMTTLPFTSTQDESTTRYKSSRWNAANFDYHLFLAFLLWN